MPCATGEVAASPRFQIGDIVEVFGTGIGLRAWQNTCTGSYVVKPDNTIGIIQDVAQCCGGYVRWKIRYVGDTVDRWSAEGDPGTGDFWLWKITSTYTVSGTVTHSGNGLSAVVMQGLPGNPTTDVNGFYSGAVSAGSSFTVTPVKAGYTFSPTSRPYSSIATNQSGQNYTATANPTSFTINGYFTLGQFAMNEDVWLYASPTVPGSPFYGYDQYSVTVPAGWSGTITPVSEGYTFNPPSRSYTSVSADDYTDNDYAASVAGAGQATLTVTLSPQEAIDDGAGWNLTTYRNGQWVSAEIDFRPSGQNIGLTAGEGYSYKVSFAGLINEGWNTPADETIVPTAGQTYSVTGTYTRMAGAVTVTIDPAAARSAGAQWRVAGGPWRNSGYTEQNVLIGQQVVEFKPLPGWIHPQNRVVSVANLDTVRIADTYVDQGIGPFIVSVSPNSGPLEGGAEVTIAGANFADPVLVTFGGVSATQATVISETEIRAKVPPRPTVASVDVSVTIGGTTVTRTNGFTYLTGVGDNVRLVGHFGGLARTLAVQGNYAYVGIGPQLHVLDISTPSNPIRRGSILLEGILARLVVSGTTAYVAASEKGLYAVDITSPTAPALQGVFDTSGTALGLDVLGGIVYVADGANGLQIIDAIDPRDLRFLGSVDTAGKANGIDIQVSPNGVFAVLADGSIEGGNPGLRIVEVSDPTQPVIRGSYEPGSPINYGNVKIANDAAFVSTGSTGSGIHILDISDPDNPALITTYNGPSKMDVDIVNSVAYTVGPFLQIVDVSDLSAPHALATNTNVSVNSFQVVVRAGLAFVAEGEKGLTIYNVSNPNATPTYQGAFVSMCMYARGVLAAGSIAYIGTLNEGLRILEVSSASSPQLVGTHGLSGGNIYTSGGLAESGTTIYVAAQDKGLQILNATNPGSPTLLGSYEGLYAMAVQPSGGLAYVGGQFDDDQVFPRQFHVLNIANPSSPSKLGSVDLGAGGALFDVALGGQFAYVSDTGRGLDIIDVSNSSNPFLRGFFDTPGDARAVAVSGDSAFVADGNAGLQVVDVTNRDAPTLLGSWDSPGFAFDIGVLQGLAYVADGATGGLQILDVSEPTSLTPVGFYDTPGSAQGVSLANDLVYVADTSAGLFILELLDFRLPTVFITNPTFNPTFATSASTINLGGGASDDRGVDHVAWVNHRGGSGTASGTESWTVSGIVLKPGNNIITVTGYDEQGNAGNDVITVTYNAPPDVEPPTVIINSPTQGGIYLTSASSIDLAGTASDDREVTQVIWTNDRGGAGNAAGMTDWWIAAITLRTGENVLTVTAYDAANNTGAATLTVTVTDADGDGVADGDDACPNTIPGVPVNSSGCPPVVPGDIDSDGDVDLHDFSRLPGCLSGPMAGLGELGCADSDLNRDGDIDLLDIARVQRCFSGTNVPADCRD